MKLVNIKLLAKGFAKSNRKQSFFSFAKLIALLSVMLGSIALTLSLSVLDGFETMLRENAVKFTAHINVTGFNRKLLKDYQTVLEKLPRNVDNIKEIAPVCSREGMLSTKNFVEGVLIKGIMPDKDISAIKNNIVQGNYFQASSDSTHKNEIIIGKRLAVKLNAAVADEVVVYVLNDEKEGEINFPEIRKFKIIGIYETGMAKYDDITVYTDMPSAQDLFNIPHNVVTGFEVNVNNLALVDSTVNAIEDYLGYPFYCLTVFDLHSPIFAWIEIQKQPIPLVLGLISIVAVFNIITILLINVVEKTRSIGVLRALGIQRRDIMSIFIFQGTMLGFAGTLLGCGLSLAFCLLQDSYGIIKLKGEIYYLDTLPVSISYMNYLFVIVGSVALSFISTLVPSYIASKVKPIKAIRFK